MSDVRRLAELSMPTELAKEVAQQIDAAGGSAAWGSITGKPTTFPVAAPTTTVRGGVLQQAAIADLTAAPTQADFNGLLAKLRAAGVLAS